MQHLNIGTYYLRTVTTHKDGKTTSTETRYSSMQDAIDEADRLQIDYDHKAASVRVYVLDSHRVPLFAGCEHPYSRRQGELRLSGNSDPVPQQRRTDRAPRRASIR